MITPRRAVEVRTRDWASDGTNSRAEGDPSRGHERAGCAVSDPRNPLPLPGSQPWRAISVGIAYLCAVGGAAWLLHAVWGTLGLVFAVLVALALSLPLALLAPSPHRPHDTDDDVDERPVLLRSPTNMLPPDRQPPDAS